MAAPSAVNQQPWEFYVVTDKAVLEKVAEALSLPETLKPFTIVPFGYPAKKNPQPDRFDEQRVHYVK